jgi:hypothetical protein
VLQIDDTSIGIQEQSIDKWVNPWVSDHFLGKSIFFYQVFCADWAEGR